MPQSRAEAPSDQDATMTRTMLPAFAAAGLLAALSPLHLAALSLVLGLFAGG